MKTDSTVTCTRVKITPADAIQILKRNTCNRKVNEGHVQVLAREMSAGRWKLNGDTISMNDDQLIDGQHRLLAVVASGVTIETMMVKGLPSDVFDTKDIGKRRTAADTLGLHGETQCKSLAAALMLVDRYMTGRVNKCVRYTNAEVAAILDQHPEIRRSVRVCTETRRLVPPSVLCGCHYLFSRKDAVAADQFVRQLVSGSGIVEGDPVYVLRERLLQNSLSKAKLSSGYIMAIIIKAWNFRRAGKRVQFLRHREEGECPEAFPLVV